MVDPDASAPLRHLTDPVRREIAMLRDLAERERRMQRAVGGRLVAPVDAVFDLLLETGSTLERQAAALQAAGAALEETAALMKGQAALFERTVAAVRTPVKVVKTAARLDDGA